MTSELCDSCKIKHICHESNKHFTESCQHFGGEIPNGFVRYYSSVSRLIYKRGFADKIAYIQRPNRKIWFSRYKLNNLLKENEK